MKSRPRANCTSKNLKRTGRTHSLVTTFNKLTTIMARWDIDGMPDVREIA